MSSDQIRNAILDAAHKNQPASLPMPHIPHFGIDDTNGLVESFSQRVARMAGTVIPDAVLDLDFCSQQVSERQGNLFGCSRV
jgi:hypothetical protein